MERAGVGGGGAFGRVRIYKLDWGIKESIYHVAYPGKDTYMMTIDSGRKDNILQSYGRQ